MMQWHGVRCRVGTASLLVIKERADVFYDVRLGGHDV
jgi:hypothetical protein